MGEALKSPRFLSLYILTYKYLLLFFRTQKGVVRVEKKVVTAPVLMWVKALDMLLERLRVCGADFSKVVAISGSAQVFILVSPSVCLELETLYCPLSSWGPYVSFFAKGLTIWHIMLFMNEHLKLFSSAPELQIYFYQLHCFSCFGTQCLTTSSAIWNWAIHVRLLSSKL